KEKLQLQKWLDAGGRDAVRKDWKGIDTFNDDPVNGPIAKMKRGSATLPALRWIPHLIYPKISDDPKELWDRSRDQWDASYATDTTSHDNITPLGPATVAVYDQNTEWNRGSVPHPMIAAASTRKDKRPFLVEFVA